MGGDLFVANEEEGTFFDACVESYAPMTKRQRQTIRSHLFTLTLFDRVSSDCKSYESPLHHRIEVETTLAILTVVIFSQNCTSFENFFSFFTHFFFNFFTFLHLPIWKVNLVYRINSINQKLRVLI